MFAHDYLMMMTIMLKYILEYIRTFYQKNERKIMMML